MIAVSNGEKKIAISPKSGAPMPHGKPFTAETARKARQKRTEKEQTAKSITAAFLASMSEVVGKDEHGDPMTGAQAIAKSIISGATKGSAEMVKIALAMTGETPSTKIEINSGSLTDLINGLKEPIIDDIHAEATRLDGGLEAEPTKENKPT